MSSGMYIPPNKRGQVEVQQVIAGQQYVQERMDEIASSNNARGRSAYQHEAEERGHSPRPYGNRDVPAFQDTGVASEASIRWGNMAKHNAQKEAEEATRTAASGGTKRTGGGGAWGSAGRLRVVEVDSLVLIKVLKHCRDNHPTPVNGQLLGMDTGDCLEVTNCFPLPQKKDLYVAVQKEKASEKDVDERVDDEFEKYQDKMAELMHNLNVDCFTVGWYQTLSFGDLKSKDNIDSLVLYQQLVDKAVVLGFDPLLNAMGKMAFKAYRVSDDFLAKYHEAEEDASKYNKLRGSDILVEVPIIIKNPLLVEAYLMDWALLDPTQHLHEFNALELNQNNYLEKNLTFLSDCLEELAIEQDKLQRFCRDNMKQQNMQKQNMERRRLENEQRKLRGETVLPIDFDCLGKGLDPPSQLPTLLMSNQASIQCKEINETSLENLGKMYLLSHGTNQAL